MKRTVLFLAASLVFSASASAGFSASEIGDDPGRAALGALLEKGLAAYSGLADYTATFRKQERSGNTLGGKETIFLKFEKPFKIFMKWLDTDKAGLQVLYERGRHDGKLAIHKPGLLLGLAPVVFLPQDSPWVREGSESYDIEDAGIGTFIEDLAEEVAKGARENKLRADVLSGTPGGPTADVMFEGSKEDEGYMAQRVVVHFDAKTSLPDRMELFGWDGKPTGIYSYGNIELNVGRADDAFRKQAFRKLYQLYQPPAPRAASSNNFSGKSPRATPTAG